jgi:hypothetical protein
VYPIFPSATSHWMPDKVEICAGNPGSFGGAYFLYTQVSTPNSELECQSISPRMRGKAEFSQIIPYESSSRGVSVEGIIQTIHAKSLDSLLGSRNARLTMPKYNI